MTVAELENVDATERLNDAQPPAATRERLVALDVFRGMTVAGMLLVNDPGAWNAIYPPFEHATWNGWTPTDLIFPFFLFIVGVTTHLSLSNRRSSGADEKAIVEKIIRRGLLIVLIGLLLNAFPFFWWGKIPDVANPTIGERIIWRFAHLRFAGVLQRIGIVYLIAALLTVKLTRRQIIATTVTILIGYWLVMTLVPVPGTGSIGAMTLNDPPHTLAAWTDRLILGENHIWASSKTWDPEGPMSTIPAVATALLGVLCGQWIAEKRRSLTDRIANLFGAGALGMLAGWIWSAVFPINKSLWTSSYVVFSAGFACVALATCIWLIDLHGVKRWTKPFVVYGTNPLIAFIGSGLMARIIYSLWKVEYKGQPTAVQAVSYKMFFEPYFVPRFASLLWALAFVTLWWAILWLFYRRNIFLRV